MSGERGFISYLEKKRHS